jgi:hypothetical protein
MKTEWLEISDQNKVIEWSRRFVYTTFGCNDDEKFDIEEIMKEMDALDDEHIQEMDRIIPLVDTKNIMSQFLKKRRNKTTGRIGLFIKENDYQIFLTELNHRMVSNTVSGLVAKGLLESAFDNDKNEFVFWVKGNKNGDT